MDIAAKNPRLTAMLTVLAGLAALAVTIVFNYLPQVTAAGPCLPPDGMVRFEFARSIADVPFLAGACQQSVVSALDAINHLDLRAYIPSYVSFAAMAAIFLGRRLKSWLVAGAVAAAVVTLVADIVETTTLLKITKDLAAAGPLYATSSTAAWIKFGALAVNSGFLAAIAWRAQPSRAILAGLLTLPVLATLALAFKSDLTAWLTYSYIAGWTPTLLIAMREAVGLAVPESAAAYDA